MERFEKGLAAGGFLPRGDAKSAHVDAGALTALIAEAEANHSDALIVIKDGHVLVERYFGHARGPIELMSITKSIVSLAVGLLISDAKIASLDVPVSQWFPEWSTGDRAKVTLRHLLTHTSGIAHQDDASVVVAQHDRLKYVRGLDVVETPGKVFSYNNEALQLLSGVIQAAAGARLDAFLKRRVFDPLGLHGWTWQLDTAGNVQTFSGLALSARDLALLGQMMLQDGKWKGKALVPADWIHLATTTGSSASPIYGLLWWLRDSPMYYLQTPNRMAALKTAGFAAVDKLAPLNDRHFESWVGYWMEAGALLSPDERTQLADLQWRRVLPVDITPSRRLGFYADGWLGQKLAVYPEWHLVVVRLRRMPSDKASQADQRASFPTFFGKVEELVQP